MGEGPIVSKGARVLGWREQRKDRCMHLLLDCLGSVPNFEGVWEGFGLPWGGREARFLEGEKGEGAWIERGEGQIGLRIPKVCRGCGGGRQGE